MRESLGRIKFKRRMNPRRLKPAATHKKWLCLYLASALTFLLLLVPLCSFAQLAVPSAPFYLNVSAEETMTFSLKIENLGEEPEGATVYLGDWERDFNGNIQYLSPGTLPQSLANWIKISPTSFTIKGGGDREIRFTISVPEGEEGSRWAVLFIQREPELAEEVVKRGEEERRVVIRSVFRYAIRIYQTVPGTEKREGKVTDIGVNLTEGGYPVKIKVEFENTGNTFLKPTGWVEFRDMEEGKTVAKIDIPEFPILPGRKRALEVSYQKELPPGKYITLAVIDYGGDNLVAGQAFFELRGKE